VQRLKIKESRVKIALSKGTNLQPSIFTLQLFLGE
jgi:hypothetical protein